MGVVHVRINIRKLGPVLLLLLCTIWLPLTSPRASLAAGPLVNGRFDRFQPLLDGGTARTWSGYPERIGVGWNVAVEQGNGLHFLDSHTLGLFRAKQYGLPYANYYADGYLSQALASASAFKFVLYQTSPVQAGQAYVFSANVTTLWQGPTGQLGQDLIFKRVGIDPTGGTNYAAASVVWSDWSGVDKQWSLLVTQAVAASANQVTVFVQVENRGQELGPDQLNLGYIDGAKLDVAAMPSPTATLIPYPTPTPVVYPTPTFTPYPLPTSTPTPLPWPTPTATATIPSAPTDVPTPTPTATASPGAAMTFFKLKTVRMLSIAENGGCMGNHHVFLSVLDSAGQPLLGAVVGDLPQNNFRVTTGEKYEPFFNWGTKLAEVSLFNNGTRLRVMEAPAGHLAVSEQTPLLSTNTWEIPVSWLVGSGYCRDEASCSGLLCQGHYSYWVVFQQVTP